MPEDAAEEKGGEELAIDETEEVATEAASPKGTGVGTTVEFGLGGGRPEG